MKHGNKFQQVKKQKFTKSIWLGFAVTIGLVIVVLSTILGKFIDTDINKKVAIYQLMEKKQFVAVRTDFYYDYFPLSNFDLKNENYFAQDGNVIKNNVIYVGSGKTNSSTSEAKKEYNIERQLVLTSAVFQLKVSKAEIKSHDYVLVVDAKQVLDKNYMTENKEGELERYYKKWGMTKVRMTFNREFLPTKLEGYCEDKNKNMKWLPIREFTYPYKTQEEFDKDMDEEIESIVAGDYHSE